LAKALQGIDVAYYLIHSMDPGPDYVERDRQSMENFHNVCLAAGVDDRITGDYSIS
jgi:hypothetical protein